MNMGLEEILVQHSYSHQNAVGLVLKLSVKTVWFASSFWWVMN